MMVCPWCNREMEAGFLMSGKPIGFGLEEREAVLWPRKEGEVKLTKQFWTMPRTPAWHCPGCKRVVVAYE